jgi:two-component system cell cycle sensor histidine kinase/response regulator CckA
MSSTRVLVVDDEKPILEFAARALGAAGYDVLRASSPSRALEIIQGGRAVDLVVSDVVMPEMQGPQLLQEIQRVSPSTGAILMSGCVGRSQLPVGVPFLPKPFSPHDLVSAVQRAMAALTREAQAASAQARALASETIRSCADARETSRQSRHVISKSKERLARQRKKPE